MSQSYFIEKINKLIHYFGKLLLPFLQWTLFDPVGRTGVLLLCVVCSIVIQAYDFELEYGLQIVVHFFTCIGPILVIGNCLIAPQMWSKAPLETLIFLFLIPVLQISPIVLLILFLLISPIPFRVSERIKQSIQAFYIIASVIFSLMLLCFLPLAFWVGYPASLIDRVNQSNNEVISTYRYVDPGFIGDTDQICQTKILQTRVFPGILSKIREIENKCR